MRRSPGTSMQRIRIPIGAMNTLAQNGYDTGLMESISPNLYSSGVLDSFGLDLSSLLDFKGLRWRLFDSYEKN